jgi:hypothetical protein
MPEQFWARSPDTYRKATRVGGGISIAAEPAIVPSLIGFTEAPLMNHPVPLGKREFVFKHPKLGERRVTVTIRADSVASVSVDMDRAK